MSGETSVCAHRVRWWFRTGRKRVLRSDLEEHAEERAEELIRQGYVAGELNYVHRGEVEIRGWWEIQP